MKSIAEIYAAVESDEAFENLPNVLSTEAGARSAILQTFDKNWDIQSVYLNYFTSDMLDRYLKMDIWRLDPWKAPAAQAINQFVAMGDSVPAQQLLNSPFFRENFHYWGDDTAHCLAGAYRFGSGYLAIGVHRGFAAGDFSAQDLTRTKSLIPHVLRLLELRALLGEANDRLRLTEASLNAQSHAVFVVDRQARPVLMNVHAEALAARCDGLRLTRIGLRANRDVDARVLARAIEEACTRTGRQGGSFRVAREFEPWLRVVVGPLTVGARTLALIVVGDPAPASLAVVESIIGLYGLTLAEAQTAAALAQGQSPAQIASTRGVSLATTRTQIRQILLKTEARGLSELVAIVATSPVRAGDPAPVSGRRDR